MSDTSYIRNVLNREPDHLIAYWPQNEPSGGDAEDRSGNGYDGTYSNVQLGQSGIGDGSLAPRYNGTNSHANLYSADLATAFNGSEGTVSAWAQTSVMNTAQARRIVTFQADSANIVVIQKGAANIINYLYRAGNTSESINRTVNTSDWFHVAMTWSKTANQVKAYHNGVLVDTATNLGTWAALPLDPDRALIGSSSPPSTVAVWSGGIAHVALWDVALSAEQVGFLAQVFGAVTTPSERTLIVPREVRTLIVPKEIRTLWA